MPGTYELQAGRSSCDIRLRERVTREIGVSPVDHSPTTVAFRPNASYLQAP
jgi:hypothetical protein